MNNLFLVLIFSLASFIAITSCQESELDIEEEDSAFRERLITKMSEDVDVQEFLGNNYSLLEKYNTWYNAKSPEEKLAYKQKIQNSRKKGKSAPFEFISDEDLQRHYAAQEKLMKRIKSKFLELDDTRIKGNFSISSVAGKIFAKSNFRITTYSDSCFEAYNECSWHCWGNGGGSVCYDACLIGFRACKMQ